MRVRTDRLLRHWGRGFHLRVFCTRDPLPLVCRFLVIGDGREAIKFPSMRIWDERYDDLSREIWERRLSDDPIKSGSIAYWCGAGVDMSTDETVVFRLPNRRGANFKEPFERLWMRRDCVDIRCGVPENRTYDPRMRATSSGGRLLDEVGLDEIVGWTRPSDDEYEAAREFHARHVAGHAPLVPDELADYRVSIVHE